MYTANEGPVRIQYQCLVSIYVFPEMKLCGLVISKKEFPHSFICERFIFPRTGLPIMLQPNRQTAPGNIYMAQRYMNVGIGKESAQFHFWEHINQTFGTVY